MKKLLTAVLFSALVSSEAFANSQNFEGANVSLGGSLTNYNSTWTYDVSGTNTSASLGHSGFVGVLGASYLAKINEKFLLGLGATYDINSISAGEAKNRGVSTGYYYDTSKIKNHYSIYLQPTYTLSDKTAVFAKIGYHNVKAEMQNAGLTTPITVNKYQTHMSGTGYGLGFMHFVEKNIFVKGEIEWVEYNAITIPGEYQSGGTGKTQYKLTSSAGIVSVGYKF